jgi:hypothetical protein
MILNEGKVLNDKKIILESLNENHPKDGYTKHDLMKILVKSCGYEVKFVFILSGLDAKRSIINTIGSVDDLLMFLVVNKILNVRRTTRTRSIYQSIKYFTINHVNFERNKLRKEKINKILNK